MTSSHVGCFAVSGDALFFPDRLLGSFFAWLLPVALPILALAAVIYFVISLPLRRQERARIFIDLMESSLAQGEPIEGRIVSLARTRDASIGVHLHLLAAYLEQGCQLIPALEKVPRLLPPQAMAMLKVGGALGDFGKVLPACRKLLRDGISQSRAAINYQVVCAFVLNPIVLFTIPFISMKVAPVMQDISKELGVTTPGAARWSFQLSSTLFWVEMLVVLALYFCTLVFLGGPRFISWIEAGLFPLSDWIYFRVPWRRKRLQRDFSAMLALLLDAKAPEARAVTLAAASTANRVFIRRAEKVAGQLRAGVKLTQAIQWLDDTGEFRWRLANAAHFSSSFFRALEGWHESLDAKAFQLEQSAAQAVTTALVLLNASSVCMTAVAIFQSLSQINAPH
jgi:type II secretory pathway component PulF